MRIEYSGLKFLVGELWHATITDLGIHVPLEGEFIGKDPLIELQQVLRIIYRARDLEEECMGLSTLMKSLQDVHHLVDFLSKRFQIV